MSDTTTNRFVASGTAAQRVAFTPSPATPASGPSPLCLWYETDTGDSYVSANGGSWVLQTSAALNLLPWKRPCRAKTTAALAANTYNNGSSGVGATLTANANGALAAQDGVTLVANESLLVANEVAGANNGIYTLTQVGSAGTPYILTRRSDATSGTGLVNATTKISEGAVAADQEWQCTTNAAITVGSTAQVWAQAGGSGGSFTAASTTEQLTGTENAKGSTPDSVAALWEQGADVASAGTTSLGEGGYFNITGTTTITDIDFATDKAGRTAWVKFAGILTLTHNASTLILPTGANITTAAGDTACFVSEGTDVIRCVAYSRASGAALSGENVIGSVTTSSSAASVTFSSIPGTYRHLFVRVLGRSNAAGVDNDPLLMQLNGDTGANYGWGRNGASAGSGASAFFSGSVADTAATIGYLAAATSTATYPGFTECQIPFYAGTAWKKTGWSKNIGRGNGTLYHMELGFEWNNAAAITSILVKPSSSTFVDGTVVELVGIA